MNNIGDLRSNNKRIASLLFTGYVDGLDRMNNSSFCCCGNESKLEVEEDLARKM